MIALLKIIATFGKGTWGFCLAGAGGMMFLFLAITPHRDNPLALAAILWVAGGAVGIGAALMVWAMLGRARGSDQDGEPRE